MSPDLVVSTGNPGELFSSPGTPDSTDFLVLPGPDDDRTIFASLFGRRYRIDKNYSRLDRTVHVKGLSLLLVDTASDGLKEEQLLWLRSQLHELSGNAVRGQILPRFVIFSHKPLLSAAASASAQAPDPAVERILIETAHFMNSSGIPGNIISVFSGGNEEEPVIHREGVRQYTVPPAAEGSALRIIRIGTDGTLETAVVYSNPEE